MSAVFVCLPEERDKWLAARRAGIGASEIAVVLGISPWDSPFSLYWRKKLEWDTDETEIMRTGAHLESSIAEWWELEVGTEEGWHLRPAGLFASSERPWQLATPDRLVHIPVEDRPGVSRPGALLECKWVSYSWDGWGEPGSGDIPAYYAAQVQQQMDVMDVDTTYVAALGPGGFRSYEVLRDPADVERIRAAGEEFMARLEADDPPPLDSHDATLSALKRLHPDLEDIEVEVAEETAVGYLVSCAAQRVAEERKQMYEIVLRDQMGGARRAMSNGQMVATRVISEVAESTRTVAAHRRDYLIPPRAKKEAS